MDILKNQWRSTGGKNSCSKMWPIDQLRLEPQTMNLHFLAVEDNYHTVGFKLISAFNWIFDASNATEDSNLKWILKMDDDVLLNTKELKNYIDGIGRNDTDSIYCRVYTKAKAIREKKARAKEKKLEKWYV